MVQRRIPTVPIRPHRAGRHDSFAKAEAILKTLKDPNANDLESVGELRYIVGEIEENVRSCKLAELVYDLGSFDLVCERIQEEIDRMVNNPAFDFGPQELQHWSELKVQARFLESLIPKAAAETIKGQCSCASARR